MYKKLFIIFYGLGFFSLLLFSVDKPQFFTIPFVMFLVCSFFAGLFYMNKVKESQAKLSKLESMLYKMSPVLFPSLLVMVKVVAN